MIASIIASKRWRMEEAERDMETVEEKRGWRWIWK